MTFYYTMALALTILKANDLKNFVHFRAGYFPSPEQLFICRKAHSGVIPSLNEQKWAFLPWTRQEKNYLGFKRVERKHLFNKNGCCLSIPFRASPGIETIGTTWYLPNCYQQWQQDICSVLLVKKAWNSASVTECPWVHCVMIIRSEHVLGGLV